MKYLISLLLPLCLGAQVRINCGGSQQVDGPLAWQADTYYSGGVAWSTPTPTPLVSPQYQTLRYGTFAYTLPAPAGPYILHLYFIENSPAITGPGQRTFDISANGTILASDYDIAAQVGLNTPLELNTPINSQGSVKVQFTTKIRNAVVSSIWLEPTAPPSAFIAGPGIRTSMENGQIIVSVDPSLLAPHTFLSILQPGPDSTYTAFGAFHGVVSQGCPLQVIVYDNSTPKRHSIGVDWSVDPDTCDIQVDFASPQSNYYVAVFGGR